MKELQQILKRIDMLAPDEYGVLATVVDVKGSSYRLPGAKMLILENGESYGTVSGGCLEADVLERATSVLESGKSQIYTYDTTNNADSVFSFNMGCRGVIRILLERIGRSGRVSEMIRTVGNISDCGEIPVIATLINNDSGPNNIGARAYYDRQKKFDFDGLPDGFANNSDFINDLHLFYADSQKDSFIKNYVFENQSYEFFFDRFSPPIRLKIFGAGADAVPLAEIAKSLGWHVTVIDHRPALANRERFTDPDKIIHARPEEVDKSVPLSENSVAVIMTHNYDSDKEIFKTLSRSNLSYVGLLGPKVRTANILRELKHEGFRVSEKSINSVYAPVGLDIGARLPETIALSIIAEIQAVLDGREGGFLRNREGSIYGRD